MNTPFGKKASFNYYDQNSFRFIFKFGNFSERALIWTKKKAKP